MTTHRGLLVTPFEAALLSLLDALLGRRPVSVLKTLLAERWPQPAGLSRNALQLVRQRLRRGIVQHLARGGWAREAFLQQGEPREGRVWRRRPLERLSLKFSKVTLNELLWMTASEFGAGAIPSAPDHSAPELGDRVFRLVAWGSLRQVEASAALSSIPSWATDGLLALFDPERFALPGMPLRFSHWLSADADWVLEAFQSRLAARWTERLKSPTAAVLASEHHPAFAHVLDRFLTEVERAGRCDLARWILQVAAQGPTRELPPTFPAEGEATPSDRSSPASALRFALVRLKKWNEEARRVGFVDDGYAAAQLWKASWERFRGDELCRRWETS